jgi:hypothetical protein
LTQKDEAYQRLMEFMLNGREPISKQAGKKNAARSVRLARRIASVDTELDSGLRALGFNRPEREKLRKRRRSSRTPNGNREMAQALLRIGFYIDQRVDWTATELDRREVIAFWADLCDHDVDKTNQLWFQGVDPLDMNYVSVLKDNGFGPPTLYRVIHGRTVLQQLRDGQTIEWCLGALHSASRS